MRTRLLRAFTVVTLVSSLAAIDRVAEAADSATGGAGGDTLWAGVQTGTPPSGGGVDGGGCRWKWATIYDSRLGSSTFITKNVGGVNYDLYERHCPSGMTLVWIPRISGATLARNASALVAARLPAPSVSMAPAADRVVVDVSTWLWADATWWSPVTATAWVPGLFGPVWARTTATPVRITFITQDDPSVVGGSVGSVVCEGRGVEWTVDKGDDVTSPCAYTYRHSSVHRDGGVFVALVVVDWDTRFTSSTGASGALSPLHTSTFMTVRVDELQALVD